MASHDALKVLEDTLHQGSVEVLWRDNVFVERLWRSVKCEEVYLRGYDSVSEAWIDRPLTGTLAAVRIQALTPDQAYSPLGSLFLREGLNLPLNKIRTRCFSMADRSVSSVRV